MSPIYKEMRRCYRAQQSPQIAVRDLSDGIDCYAGAYSREGRLLQLFVNSGAARREIDRQQSKASKHIR